MKKLLATIPGLLGSDPEAILKYLEEIRKRGATGIRLFLNTVWALGQGREHASPYVIKEWRNDQDFPEWDIHGYVLTPVFEHAWNPTYFDLLSTICSQLKRLDMTLEASLHDFCSWKLPGSYAYYSRTKAWNAWWQFRHEYGGFGIFHENKEPFHREWLDKIISFLDKAGIEYDIETCNEYAPTWLGATEAEAVRWHNWFVDELIARGISLDRIHYSGEFYSDIKWGIYDHHGVSNPERYNLTRPTAQPPEKFLLSNDGGGNNPGNDGPPGIYGRVETGIQSAEFIADKIIEEGYLGFEFLSHSCEFPGEC